MLFLIFFENFFSAEFVVIGFKRGNSPALGEKQAAVTLEFGKSREAGVSAHFTHVKQPYIAQNRDAQTPLQIMAAICRLAMLDWKIAD